MNVSATPIILTDGIPDTSASQNQLKFNLLASEPIFMMRSCGTVVLEAYTSIGDTVSIETNISIIAINIATICL